LRLKTFGGLWIDRQESRPDALSVSPRPRPLALLAILAADAPKGTSRERVLGILWPESDPERARHALSQTLYSLKRDLGVDLVVATPDLRLDRALISSDLEEFRAAVAAKEWERAAHLYAGPFLEGFYLGDAPEFERWVEEERGALASAGMRAIEQYARASAEHGRHDEAVEQWRRLTRLDPLNARFASSYMEALARLGDRAAALAHGKSHIDLVRRELEAPPDKSISQLMARLREEERISRPVQVVSQPSSEKVATVLTTVAPAPVVPAAPPEREFVPSSVADSGAATKSAAPPRRHRPLKIAAAAALAVVIISLAWRTVASLRADERPVLAVGRIRDLVAPDSIALGGVLSEMLSTSLGRVDDLQVIANSRILELTPREADTSRTALTDAARRAGATEIVEGELRPLGDRALMLEIRRVDMSTGFVREAYRIEGADRISLFDSVTKLIAADLRLGTPSGSLAQVSTNSPIAYRLYEEGLRAFFQFDAPAAARLFRAAIQEDSTFAMATYYAWRTAGMLSDSSHYTLGERAAQLGSRASPRDRLLIRAHVGTARDDLGAIAAAESLAALYPRDPEALIRAAAALPDFARTVALLDRSIALDSAAGVGTAAVCRLCDALHHLAASYVWADSMAAAERTLRRWMRLRSGDATPWGQLADLYIGLGRVGDAHAARRKFIELGGPRDGSEIGELVTSLRTDDLARADSLCRTHLPSTEDDSYGRWRWFCVIGLRLQGRHRDALALNADGRIPGSETTRRSSPPDRIVSAILDFEMGRPLIAASQYLDIAREMTRFIQQPGAQPKVFARGVTWNLTLAATAMVEAGDTIGARALVDSIEAMGQRSLHQRDPRLHHFVRGLLYSREDRHVPAVSEFERAMQSPTHGYTRISYELAKSLRSLHRYPAAIATVQPLLRGGIEGSALYLTRTEAHELLAQLFSASGQRDSAATHFLAVERAWRSADPQRKVRYDAARRWLAENGRLPREVR
jgi:DNA-binding SARP family transcriptional activator/tetratricopeptide (TPR) repeat protein